jgi:putative endonuclease
MKAVVERQRLSPFPHVSMKSYQVYLIENPSDRRYIGLSENVMKRLEDHNNGVSKWTAKYVPWSLVWTSNEMGLSDARRLENLLKRQKGGNGLSFLLDKYKGS